MLELEKQLAILLKDKIFISLSTLLDLSLKKNFIGIDRLEQFSKQSKGFHKRECVIIRDVIKNNKPYTFIDSVSRNQPSNYYLPAFKFSSTNVIIRTLRRVIEEVAEPKEEVRHEILNNSLIVQNQDDVISRNTARTRSIYAMSKLVFNFKMEELRCITEAEISLIPLNEKFIRNIFSVIKCSNMQNYHLELINIKFLL
jgi:hypothetical protein